MNKNILNVLFVLVCLIDIYVACLNNDSIRVYTKPLPILVIGVIYFFTAKNKNQFILGSLLISFIADMFLLYKLENFSMLLMLFTVAHALCIKVLLSELSSKAIEALLKNFLLFMLFFVVISIFVIKEFVVGSIVILIYGTSISFFAASAFSNYLYKINRANHLIFIGVFIHLMSDGIYSLNLFQEPDFIYTFMVLVTYFTGHFLLYRGFALQTK